VFRSTKKPLR